MDDDVFRFIQAGADDVLVKPLKSDYLDEILLHAEKNGFLTLVDLTVNPFTFTRRTSLNQSDNGSALKTK